MAYPNRAILHIRGYDRPKATTRQRVKTHPIRVQLGLRTHRAAQVTTVVPMEKDLPLGKPWMIRHNPPVNWCTNQVFLGEHTITACTGSRCGDIDIQSVTAAQIKRTLSREKAQDVETYVTVVKSAEEHNPHLEQQISFETPQ